MAFFSSAVASAVTAATGLAWLGAAAAGAVQVAVGIGVSLIAKAIAGEPEGSKFGVQAQLQGGDDVPRSIIFGRACTAGSLVYHNTWGTPSSPPNAFHTRVIALSDYPIQSLDRVFAQDLIATLRKDEPHVTYGWPVEEYRKNGVDHMWVKFHDGNQTAADPWLVAEVGNSERPYGPSRIGKGIAYAVVTCMAPERIDGEERPLFSGIPPMKFEVTGARLYDPSRDSSVGGDGPQRWNDRSTWGGDGDHLPIVQAYNILRGITYDGNWVYGLQSLNVNRIPIGEVIDQINKCREEFEGPNGYEQQYRTGGELQVGAQIKTALEALLTACQGRMVEVGGSYKFHVGAPEEPIFSFSDADIISTEDQTFSPFYGLEDSINGIQSTFPNPDEGWKTKTAPPLFRTDLEVLDGNRRLMANVSLDMVWAIGQVERLQKSAMEEAQRARRHTLVLGPEAWVLEPGDIVQWTSARNGYVTKLFRVDGIADRADLDVLVDITEVDPSDYDWDFATDFRPIFDGPLVLVETPKFPTIGWQAYGVTVYDNVGNARRPGIEVLYQPGLQNVESVRIQVRMPGETNPFLDVPPISYGDPWRTQIVGNLLPNTDYEVRGIYIMYDRAPTEWSAWLAVKTPDVRFGEFDLYDGVIGFDKLKDDVRAYQDWVGPQLRDVIEQIQTNFSVIDQDFANYRDKEQLRTEIVIAKHDVTASYRNEITVAVNQVGDNIDAISQRVETIEIEVPNKASISAVNALGGRVTTAEGEITAINSALVSVNSSLAGKADASALLALDSQVSNINGRVTSNSNAIISVNNTLGDLSADANFRAETYASDAGYAAKIGLEARTGGAGSYRSASLFLDVPASTASPTRVTVLANQFVVANSASGAKFTPFIVQGGTVYIDNARIRDLTGDQIRVNSIDASQYLLNGTVVTDKLRNNAVTDAVTFTSNNPRGTIASGNFNVTSGRVLMIAAGFLDRPESNPGNFGFISFKLKYNGLTVKTAVSSYDDQSGYGVPMVYEFSLPTGTYNFSFHADNLSGPGLWQMLDGSTLTLINLKK